MDVRDAGDALAKVHAVVAHHEKIELQKRSGVDLPVVNIVIHSGGAVHLAQVVPAHGVARAEAPAVEVAEEQSGRLHFDFEPIDAGTVDAT